MQSTAGNGINSTATSAGRPAWSIIWEAIGRPGAVVLVDALGNYLCARSLLAQASHPLAHSVIVRYPARFVIASARMHSSDRNSAGQIDAARSQKVMHPQLGVYIFIDL